MYASSAVQKVYAMIFVHISQKKRAVKKRSSFSSVAAVSEVLSRRGVSMARQMEDMMIAPMTT